MYRQIAKPADIGTSAAAYKLITYDDTGFLPLEALPPGIEASTGYAPGLLTVIGTGDGSTLGPYTLPGIQANEQVSVGGIPQVRGTDYSYDSVAGTITFITTAPGDGAVILASCPEEISTQTSGGGAMSYFVKIGEGDGTKTTDAAWVLPGTGVYEQVFVGGVPQARTSGYTIGAGRQLTFTEAVPDGAEILVSTAVWQSADVAEAMTDIREIGTGTGAPQTLALPTAGTYEMVWVGGAPQTRTTDYVRNVDNTITLTAPVGAKILASSSAVAVTPLTTQKVSRSSRVYTGASTSFGTSDDIVVFRPTTAVACAMPSSPAKDDHYTAKAGATVNGTNAVTFTPGAGHTIDGQPTFALNGPHAAVTFVFDGTSDWMIL